MQFRRSNFLLLPEMLGITPLLLSSTWGVDSRDLTRDTKSQILSMYVLRQQMYQTKSNFPLYCDLMMKLVPLGRNLLNSFYVNQVPLVKHSLVLLPGT